MLIDANSAVTICTDNIGPIFTLGIIHMAVCIISTWMYVIPLNLNQETIDKFIFANFSMLIWNADRYNIALQAKLTT